MAISDKPIPKMMLWRAIASERRDEARLELERARRNCGRDGGEVRVVDDHDRARVGLVALERNGGHHALDGKERRSDVGDQLV